MSGVAHGGGLFECLASLAAELPGSFDLDSIWVRMRCGGTRVGGWW